MLMASIIAGPAIAKTSDKSAVTIYGGALALDKGQGTRIYVGGFGDYYTGGQIGFHADVVHVSREETATYVAIGTSWNFGDHLRPKIMIGTSSSNVGILPDEYVAVTVRIKPGSDSGWVVTPGLTYRHYRNGRDETIGTLATAKYFRLAFDKHGYYVAQGSVSTSLGGNVRGQSAATIGMQTVRSSGVSFGVIGEIGALVRDPVASNIAGGQYYAVRPMLSIPLLHNVDMFARGEYADTTLYTATGGSTGLKLEF